MGWNAINEDWMKVLVNEEGGGGDGVVILSIGRGGDFKYEYRR